MSLNATFDESHPAFGELYDELSLWSAPFGLMLLDRVPLRTGMTVLDVGSGTGFLTIELAQRCGTGSQVIAVDPWHAGMSRLRRKLDALGLENVRLVEQDAAFASLPAASVDLIVSNLGVNNFENADSVLRSCFQAAKPNADLVLTTNLVGHMREFFEVYRAVLVELGLAEFLPALDAHIERRGTLETVTDLVTRAGFTVERITTDAFRMRFADGTSLLQHRFIRFAFLPAWRSIVDAGVLAPVFAALEQRLNAVARERGDLTLTIPMACFEARRAATAVPLPIELATAGQTPRRTPDKGVTNHPGVWLLSGTPAR